jgi:hypothetical protein
LEKLRIQFNHGQPLSGHGWIRPERLDANSMEQRVAVFLTTSPAKVLALVPKN